MAEQNRKTVYLLALLGVAILAAAVLSSCDLLFGVTIDQRIKDFSSGYTGGDYTNLYKNFSDNTQDKNAMKSATYWDSTPFAAADSPQAITKYSISGSTVSGIFSNANGVFNFTMQMEKSGMNWYILSINLTLTGSTTPFVIKRIY